MEEFSEHWQRWADLIVRSWEDDALRDRILAEPERILREIGVELPEGVTVRVVADASEAPAEASDSLLVLPLPGPPPAGQGVSARELSDSELDRVSGGGSLSNLGYGDYLSSNIGPLQTPKNWGSWVAP